MITIAHRLNTIINYDKIMVLKDGKIVEFDDPKVLVKNENSFFTEMLKENGEDNF